LTDNGHDRTPTRLRVSQAAKAVGRARSTLNRDIAQGKISVTRSGTGQPYIEISELERAYGQVDIRTLAETVRIGQDGTAENRPDIGALQRELSLLREERERERQQAETVVADLVAPTRPTSIAARLSIG
jgi:predicted site-specific integrase-resolvase